MGERSPRPSPYFGKIGDDLKGKVALDRWFERKDDLLAGRTARIISDGLTIRELCSRFRANRQDRMQAGRLMPVSFPPQMLTAFLPFAFVLGILVDDTIQYQSPSMFNPLFHVDRIIQVHLKNHRKRMAIGEVVAAQGQAGYH